MKIETNILLAILAIFLTLSVNASDRISSRSVQAKIVEINEAKNPDGSISDIISIDLKGKIYSIPFYSIFGGYYYKADFSKAPLESINKDYTFNMQIGTYKEAGSDKTTELIYYIGQSPFDAGRAE